MSLANLAEAERKVFSQNGEDGVIEAIFSAIGTTNRFFVEFGCDDATECNTANLLRQGWTGLLMDGQGISNNPLATVHQEFITAENINDLFGKHGVPHAFDFLSIDIDGNDYWVWQALTYRPRVIAIEYNASVPVELARVIPYDPQFKWRNTDYFGASLRALAELGDRKGYELVHCEKAGANAFFIDRAELPASYEKRALAAIYRPANYFYAGQGHLPEARHLMLDPEGPELFNQAVSHHQRGHSEQAAVLYHQFLQDNPDHADTVYLLALLEHEAGRHDAALKRMQQAIALKPVSAKAYFNMGDILRDLGRREEAIRWYQESLNLNPRLVDAVYNLAMTYKDLAQWEPAESCFHQVTILDRVKWSAFNNRGNLLMKLGRLAEAVTSFHKALELNPRYATAFGNLGIAYCCLRDRARAIASFQEALRIDPSREDVQNNLRLVLRSQEPA